LRTRGSDNGSLVPTPATAGESAVTQVVLAFDDNRLASVLFGQYGQNLSLIERRLGVVADSRGNHVTIEGPRDACEQARRVLEGLYERLKRGGELVAGDVEGAIRLAIAQGSLFDYDPAGARQSFDEINLRKRPVRARTAAQDAYIRGLRRHALVFGTGPAGTGKTWLAVAHAVALFERKEVDRIILSRPAVEAGERLGFPPGQTSGLAEAVRLLAGVEGVGHCVFTAADVIRHELVGRIVAAYDRASARKREAKE
jgi:phosphate starvation-inducible PhoH-like protein